MGEQEWEDCLLFITDPATGEQREIGAVKNIEWPEIQKHPKRAYVSYPIPLKDLPNQSDNVQRF